MIRKFTSVLLFAALSALTIGCFCGMANSASAAEMSCHLEEVPSCCCGSDEVRKGSQVPTDPRYLIPASFSLEDLQSVDLHVQHDVPVSRTGAVGCARRITSFKAPPAYLLHQSFLI